MSLLRSSLVVAVAAALSRILGFARDVLIAGLFGASPVADALLAALRIPNLIRRLLGEGALNAGFVPIYHRLKDTEGEARAGAFAARAFINIALIVSALTAITMIAAPLLIALLAAGYQDDPALMAQAAGYLRAALPFALFAVLASLLAGWLNAERRVAAGAFAPLATNALLIALLVWLGWNAAARPADAAAWLFAAGWSVAGAVQLVMMLLALKGLRGASLRAGPGFDADQRRLLAATPPGLVAAGASQVIMLGVAIIASFTPSALSWFYYAERLVMLPLGFIAVVTGMVLLPELSRTARSGQAGLVLERALDFALILAVPAAAALALLAEPIASILFERGAYTARDTQATAALIAGLAPGLVFAAAGQVLSQVLIAREALRVPLGALGLGLAAALVTAGTLSGPAGLGLAASAGFAVHALALAAALVRARSWRPTPPALSRMVRIAGATGLMALTVAFLADMAAAWLAPDQAGGTRLIALAGICLSGIAAYGAAAWVLRLVSPAELHNLARPD